jgi:hypothetical protein
MPPRTWKSIEARVAKIFGTRRRRASGADPFTGADDLILPGVFVEVRYRTKFGVLTWWDQDVIEPSTKEKKFPVLVIVEKRRLAPFIVAPLDAEYLIKLAGILKATKTVVPQSEVDKKVFEEKR